MKPFTLNKAPVSAIQKKARLFAVLFWLILWQLAASAVALPLLLPTPLAVGGRLASLAVTAPFWRSIGYSLLRILGGFSGGLVCGALLAALAFALPWVKAVVDLPMAVIKTAPVASFIILALVWISGSHLSLFISFLMVLPLVYGNILQGLQSADPQLLEMAQVFRFSVFQVWRSIYLPAALPSFYAALKTALGFAWKSGIAGEVLAIPSGALGTQLYQAKVALETTDLFAWTAVIILLSMLLEKAFLRFLKPVVSAQRGDTP